MFLTSFLGDIFACPDLGEDFFDAFSAPDALLADVLNGLACLLLLFSGPAAAMTNDLRDFSTGGVLSSLLLLAALLVPGRG